VCGGRHLALGGHEELLISAIDELGDLALDKVSGTREHFHAAVIAHLDGGRTTVLLEEHALLRTRSFQDLKAVLAQPFDCIFEGSVLDLSPHHCLLSSGLPRRDAIARPLPQPVDYKLSTFA